MPTMPRRRERPHAGVLLVAISTTRRSATDARAAAITQHVDRAVGRERYRLAPARDALDEVGDAEHVIRPAARACGTRLAATRRRRTRRTGAATSSRLSASVPASPRISSSGAAVACAQMFASTEARQPSSRSSTSCQLSSDLDGDAQSRARARPRRERLPGARARAPSRGARARSARRSRPADRPPCRRAARRRARRTARDRRRTLPRRDAAEGRAAHRARRADRRRDASTVGRMDDLREEHHARRADEHAALARPRRRASARASATAARERLLAVDVLARLERGERDLGVQADRREVEDGVDGRVREQIRRSPA